MKKYCSLIVLICGLVPGWINAGNAPVAKEGVDSNTASISFFSHPHTELDIFSQQGSPAANAVVKVQSPAVALAHVVHLNAAGFVAGRVSNGNKRGVYDKDYLLHIHPTHNFW